MAEQPRLSFVLRIGGFMRERGLVERLDGAMPVGIPGSVSNHRLDDVARALRAVTERTASTIGMTAPAATAIRDEFRDEFRADAWTEAAPVIDDAANSAAVREIDHDIDHDIDHGADLDDEVEAEPEMPQILQHSSSAFAGNDNEPRGRAHGQAIAPMILAVSILAVGVLMTASFADLSRVPGLAFLAEKPRPRLSVPVVHAAAPRPALLVASFDANAASGDIESEGIVKEPRNPEPGPILSLEELALLERCEGLIAAGDIRGARQELALAASAGSVNARFALAETFDPNVLAAWGLRERVADAGTARVLYGQAFDAGDQRAEIRLAALRDSD